MVIPAQFVRPQSVLERLAFLMQHGKYLEDIVVPNLNPVDRLKVPRHTFVRSFCMLACAAEGSLQDSTLCVRL